MTGWYAQHHECYIRSYMSHKGSVHSLLKHTATCTASYSKASCLSTIASSSPTLGQKPNHRLAQLIHCVITTHYTPPQSLPACYYNTDSFNCNLISQYYSKVSHIMTVTRPRKFSVCDMS